MNRFSPILIALIASFLISVAANGQQKPPAKINDIFFEYVSKTLKLKPSEAAQMRPLVKKYLNERKKIAARFSDPLEREQQILTLKISSRKEMVPIVGMQKANAFFSSEQVFRRKVREELKQRSAEHKKN